MSKKVIFVDKLYEILNELGVPYNLSAQSMVDGESFRLVRCEGCKHYDQYTKPVEDFDGHCEILMTEVDDDFFCAYGELRDV